MATTLTKSATAELQRLQSDMETMIRDTIAPTLAEVVARAAGAALYGSNQVRDYSDTVAGGIRSRPLISVLVAAGIGFVLGRASVTGKE